jgi:hypothetical protein
MRNNIFVPIFFLAVTSFSTTAIYFMWKKDHTCDSLIIMKSGEKYEAMEYYNNPEGMITVVTCDDVQLRFPVTDVKRIEEIKPTK